MNFWASSETDGKAGDIINNMRKVIEPKINSRLTDVILENGDFQDWEWAYIAISLNPKMGIEFKEIIRKNTKSKDLEFRFKIDYQNLLEGDTSERYRLYFNSLRRCVNHEKMTKWGFYESDKLKLLEMLSSVESEILKNIKSD